MSDFVEVLPYTHFIQAKFVEIDDDLHDLHVPWAQIVPTLLDNPGGPATCPASTRAVASRTAGATRCAVSTP